MYIWLLAASRSRFVAYKYIQGVLNIKKGNTIRIMVEILGTPSAV